jgi:hypothetical protein
MNHFVDFNKLVAVAVALIFATVSFLETVHASDCPNEMTQPVKQGDVVPCDGELLSHGDVKLLLKAVYERKVFKEENEALKLDLQSMKTLLELQPEPDVSIWQTTPMIILYIGLSVIAGGFAGYGIAKALR